MNPIKALWRFLKRLIFGYETALIAEKKVALLQTELSIITKQGSSLKAENENLKVENQELRQQVENYKKVNDDAFAKPLKYAQMGV